MNKAVSSQETTNALPNRQPAAQAREGTFIRGPHREAAADNIHAPAAKTPGRTASDNRHRSTATARTRRRDIATLPPRRCRREDKRDAPGPSSSPGETYPTPRAPDRY